MREGVTGDRIPHNPKIEHEMGEYVGLDKSLPDNLQET